MNFPDRRTLLLLIVRYRALLIALLVFISAFALLGTSHRGQPVLIANHDIAAGASLGPGDFTVAYLDAAIKTAALDSLGQASASAVFIRAGALLTPDLLASNNIDVDRIVVSMPLESSEVTLPRVGTHVHVWALGDEFTALVSSDGVVVGGVDGNIATLSIPLSDERAVMQAAAVRLSQVNQP